MPEHETYTTIAHAASILRVSKMTIYRMVHDGSLEAVKVGRSFRIVVDDFLRHFPHAAGHPKLLKKQ